jgi:glycosyltransferase involved in cell wall biosynthesis
MARPYISHAYHAVSIIVCTNRRHCMHNLFRNYGRQNCKNKELIVILNRKKLNVNEYIKAARPYRNVRIYSLPDRVSLGNCLNYGVKLARHTLIAKFDDDDYYAPNYISESIRSLFKTNADIVGKRAHYMYLNGKKLLLLRYPNRENRFVPLVQGATLLVKRTVFRKVSFRNRNRGECIWFCADTRAKGFKIYSGSRYNFLAIRRRNTKDHTWQASDKQLLAGNVKVLKAKNILSLINRR